MSAAPSPRFRNPRWLPEGIEVDWQDDEGQWHVVIYSPEVILSLLGMPPLSVLPG